MSKVNKYGVKYASVTSKSMRALHSVVTRKCVNGDGKSIPRGIVVNNASSSVSSPPPSSLLSPSSSSPSSTHPFVLSSSDLASNGRGKCIVVEGGATLSIG